MSDYDTKTEGYEQRLKDIAESMQELAQQVAGVNAAFVTLSEAMLDAVTLVLHAYYVKESYAISGKTREGMQRYYDELEHLQETHSGDEYYLKLIGHLPPDST